MQEAKLRYLRSGATPDVYALALPVSGANDPFGEQDAPVTTIAKPHAVGRTEFTLQMNRHERRAAAKRERNRRR